MYHPNVIDRYSCLYLNQNSHGCSLAVKQLEFVSRVTVLVLVMQIPLKTQVNLQLQQIPSLVSDDKYVAQ